jgi:hypothetical protein
MSDAWTLTGETWAITAEPRALMIPTGDAGRVLFAVINLGATARLADLKIVPDAESAHPSWFTIDPPAVVLPGRSVEVAVLIQPRVSGLGHGEQYTFRFHGQVDSVVSGDVSVAVSGGPRWQVTVSPQPQPLEVLAGDHALVYTVTNLGAEAATAVLEAPYPQGRTEWAGAEQHYHLDQSQQLIRGSESGAFTLKIEYSPSNSPVDFYDTVEGRVTTAGGGDPVQCPPVRIHYQPFEVAVLEPGRILDPLDGLS